jgi:hypothetical protein
MVQRGEEGRSIGGTWYGVSGREEGEDVVEAAMIDRDVWLVGR